MERFFRRWARITLVAIYLIIVAGGVVRMTGSGMGCPDWPTCFGQWIPPTDVSELPENYAEIYQEKYGYTDTTFNVFHTWTEYINRLIGFLAGNFTLILLLLAIILWIRKKADIWQPLLCLLLVLAMGFQAWLGAKVVYSELAVSSITIHMIMALLIVMVNLLIIYRANKQVIRPKKTTNRLFLWLIIGFLVLLAAQILLGTGVREEIDAIAEAMDHAGRDTWIGQLSSNFIVHRSFSWGVLLVSLGLFILNATDKWGYTLTKWILGFVIVSIIAGIGMAYANIPAWLQPIHLVLASVMFGAGFYLLLQRLGARSY